MTDSAERVGPYVLEAVIGRGGMGVVHRARDPAGRAVALKRLLVHDAEVIQRMAREADVRVSHPSVVRVLASGIDGKGDPYVVTELLEGKPLPQALAERHDLGTVVRWFAEAAEGLAAIHAAGIVHRDLKPMNLFVTREGVLKILDFGIATFAGSTTQLTATGALVGTPAYFSPEQARGAPVDARSDVWGLGMTLYEAVSGELPFRRESLVACAFAVQNERLPSLYERALVVPVSLDLVAIIERCLAKSPADRFASAAELAQALRDVRLDGEGRPSQPLLAAPSETWRTVAIVVVEGTLDASELSRVTAAGAELVRDGSRTVLALGRTAPRSDEIGRAIDLAGGLAHGRVRVVGSARSRAMEPALDSGSLRDALECLERAAGPGVWLTSEVAAIAGQAMPLAHTPEGLARVASTGEPTPREAPSGPVLVGRDAELALLEAAAARARAGALAHVVVVGETGIGKTALVRTLLERLRVEVPFVVVRVGRVERSTTPFAALFDALELDDDGACPPGGLAVDRRRARVLDQLGEDLVRGDLVVLVLEGTEALDAGSRSLLDGLEGPLGDRPLLVVETASAPVGSRGEVIAIGPLGPQGVGRLVERIAGPARARAVAESLALRSGGNPGFAIQLAELARARGADADVARWELPATVESAIEARLDGLPDDLRRATYTLAVVGPEATLDEARWALGPASDGWVHALVGAAILETDTRQGRARYRFRSALVAEVAYAALAPETAKRIHGSLAARLASSPEASPERVLHHADRGADRALAARFVASSLARAARLGDGRRVLSLLDRMRDEASPTFAALFAGAEAAAFVSDARDPEELLREALPLASSTDERAMVLAELGERARRSSRIDDARARLEEAIALAPGGDIAARATARLALVHLSEGDSGGAHALLVACPLDGASPMAAAMVWDTRGYVHGARGELGARRDAYERAAALYTEAGDARRAAGASANLGDTLREIGELAAAESALRRAIDGARRVGNGLTEAYATTNLAATLIAAGRPREAVATLDLAASRAEHVRDERLSCVIVLHRAGLAGRALVEAERVRLRAAAGEGTDATLRALELANELRFGAPTDAMLDEARRLLERGREIEEGELELASALHALRPDEGLRRGVLERVTRSYASLDRPAMRGAFRERVARVTAGWITLDP